jgi:segregation and condensation protein B
MDIKGKIEAVIYAAEEPVTVEQIAAVLKDVTNWQPEPELPVGDQSQPLVLGAENSEIELADRNAAEPVEAAAPQKKLRKPDPLSPLKAEVRAVIEQLVSEYDAPDSGMEIRSVAGGYRMATKPEHHDVVRGFAKSLKPPVRLSLAALETLAVIAYKQPITVPEVSEIRGVDAGGVIGTLLDRKLITTSGRKQVIGRPILYKTTREFLLRFGLKDVAELPSMEEFEKLMSEAAQGELMPSAVETVTELTAEATAESVEAETLSRSA